MYTCSGYHRRWVLILLAGTVASPDVSQNSMHADKYTIYLEGSYIYFIINTKLFT